MMNVCCRPAYRHRTSGLGVHGGNVIAQGTAEEVKLVENSITGQYLSGRKKIQVPKKRRKSNGKSLEIIGASENNLKNINVEEVKTQTTLNAKRIFNF